MLLSSSHLYTLFITSGLLVLTFAQTSPISGGSCPTPPTITLAQYNQIKAGTTISQMETILGGLGYPFGTEFVDLAIASSQSYTYQGKYQVPIGGGQSGLTYGSATFTFIVSTQNLTFKSYTGLC